ncbi:MAG: GvpL/GvpF family gas vesicle protein [Planctomycetes bacterium]|nr:GvpL/GvpF family gas vesicle protein [Planctomycetota bacterium]
MLSETIPATAHYLYAIMSTTECLPEEGTASRSGGLTGIDGSPVYAICKGQVAAIVSRVPYRRLRPERRHLAAHQEVLRHLTGSASVLPLSFGIIADGPRAIERILSRNHRMLVEELERLTGKVEMGLRITWDVPNIFEYFVHVHPELQAARDQLLRGPGVVHQQNKIEMGRLFDRILNEDREAHTRKVEETLSASCHEIKRNAPRNEREVANLACLVDRHSLSGFETVVLEAARSFSDSFAFDFNGPWPPHNFVSIQLDI